MTIECPYCQHTTALKAARPGRFTSACPKCSRKFLITIPDDPAGAPSISRLRAEGAEQGGGASESAARAKAPTAASQATGDWTPPAPTPATQPAATTGAVQPRATAATAPTPAETQAFTDPQATQDAIGGDPSAPTVELGFDVAFGAQGAPSDDAGARPAGVPATLGGYQLVKELGRGGMGAVYLARQLSLDRNVALKVMRPEWASNPTFVSRFTREAYAAAQLVHHNVVQIYDFGEDHGTSYFSMEFVRGQTLAQLVGTQKKLDPEVAVGFVLQAARGLKFAHDQSMIHRDIKPENLLLNDQGVVKVADLGLVKTPELIEAEEADAVAPASAPAAGRGSSAASDQVTRVGVAMGTPAFMAPEQGSDAAHVDARADIYSLGCTLYALVTGRPPFEGKSALELISKHRFEPIVPPEAIVKRVPKALSEIILKMVAKRPEERYADLGQVIKALEDYLGVSSTAPFSPREEHANLLAESVEAFEKAPTAKLRPWLAAGGLAACVLFALIALIARRPLLAAGFLGLVPMTALAYFVIHGLSQKSFLFLKARELAFGSSLTDWLTALAVVALFVTVLVVFHLFWAWLALAVLAVGLAVALHFGVDKKIEAERRGPIEDVEQMLKKMRLQGLEEEVLRQFVCKYSGERWEEFYEELFGYEAKLVARDRWGRGERARPRPKYAAWREPIIAWADARRKARREAREKRLLQKVEERSLEAQGVNLVTARRKAQRAAEAMVATAAEMRSAAAASAAASRADRRAIAQALRQAAEAPEKVLVVRERGLLYGRRTSGPLNLVFGPRPRFLVGIALLAGCLLWMHQNKMISGEQVKAAAESAVKTGDIEALRDIGADLAKTKTARTKPLELPLLPRRVRELVDFNAGAAGLILVVSALFRGLGVGVLSIAGAAVALFGLLPASLFAFVPVGARWANMVAGAALAVLGILFGRGRA